MEITIKKGLDLRLQGAVELPASPVKVAVSRAAVCPDDYEGFIPKTDVRVGDKVSVGDPLLHDKNDPRIKLVSPVSGVVAAVDRGARRHIERVVVDVEGSGNESRKFDISRSADPEGAMQLLAESGLLALIRRRPYADIPAVDVRPRDIFVTAFDSAPLAVDRVWTAADTKALQAGASLLATVTTGKVYVSRRSDSTLPALKNVTDVTVKGPHPAGLAGVQAANIAPVNKGETVWTLSAETMWRIGRLMTDGVVDSSTLVAVCGSCIDKPYVAATVAGAPVESLLKNHEVKTDRHVRVISGNVLTGVKVDAADGYLRYPYTQLTVIPEGDDVDEFMGWASLSPSKMSVSPTFPGRFLRKLFNPDARIHGGRRAMIMSGQYDSVIPMDILPEYLIKAINANDIEGMEKLGIYEVAPEDFALAEVIDSSKQPLQQIVRSGLEYLRKELQ